MSIYLVLDDKYFIGIWNRTLEIFIPSRKESINHLLHEIDFVLSRFIRGIAIDACIVAIFSLIAISILGLKFAVFVGVFAGICNVIPYFGPILGMIPAFLIGALTDGLQSSKDRERLCLQLVKEGWDSHKIGRAHV